MAHRSIFLGAALAVVTLVACSGGRETNVESAEGELRRAGQTCGGTRNLKCSRNLKCVQEDSNDDSSGPPPGALGMPLPPEEGNDAGASEGNGPPPGAVGMPILPQQREGKCHSCFGAWTDQFGGCRSPNDGTYPAGCCVDAPNVVAGAFKLYAEPNHEVNETCDMYTSLSLTAAGKAKLDHKVGGVCEIMASPDPRTYNLKLVDEPCGSKAYEGQRRVDGRVDKIKLIDHRSRRCRDLQPAQIMVEETRDGQTHEMFSKDR